MKTDSSICQCELCAGKACTCGCQDANAERRAGCQCGEVCACDATCDCKETGQGARTKRLATVVALIGLAAFPAAPAVAQSIVCGTAMLTDVEAITARVPQSTITSVRQKPKDGRTRDRGADAYTTPSERQTKTYLVTVRLNHLVYTGQASGNWFWEFDPTRLVINDPVEACVSKDTLRLRRPDGKDYNTKIVRVVREVAQDPGQQGSGR